MIELRHLYKTYVPNKQTKVDALKDINLTFGNNGLVFLLGKSGSGKTTMLNMIGGLDNPTSGEIVVDNKPLNIKRESDINKYRNNKVGYIFQNYGLLEDSTVKNNIKIALEMQNVWKKKEKIQAILDKVGLSQYINKKITQLSGGQKQRVAIARALVKDSDIILADEPTGNLDETNSREIFEMLREIAKTRLVIVVSHSQKFAQEYAQRIITLKDGQVVEDSLIEEPQPIAKKEVKNKQKKTFPVSTSLRFAFNNIGHVMGRFLLTLVFMVVAITMFGAGLSATRYDKYEFIENALKDNNITTYTAMSSIYDEGRRKPLWKKQLTVFDDDQTINVYYSRKFSICYGKIYVTGKCIILDSNKYYDPDSVAVYDINKMKKIGISLFRGKAPTKINEIVITKYFADGLLDHTIFKQEYNVNSYDDIVDKEIEIMGYKQESYKTAKLKIVGIVDTKINYQKLMEQPLEEREKYASEGLHCTYFATQEFVETLLKYPINDIEVQRLKGYFIDLNDKEVMIGTDMWNSKFAMLEQQAYAEEIYGFPIRFRKGHDLVLDDDEMVVNENVLMSMYNHQNGSVVFKMIEKSEQEDKQKLEKLINEGMSVWVKIGEKDAKFRIAGTFSSEQYTCIVVGNNTNITKNDLETKCVSASYGNDIGDLVKTFKNNEIEVVGDIYKAIDKASNQITPVVTFGILGFCLFGLFALMMLSSFVSSMIQDNYRQLGILRALGSSKFNLVGIYLLVSLILVIICNAIALPMLPYVKGFLQAKEINQLAPNYVVFDTPWYDYLIIIGLSIAITFVGSIVHIITKTNQPPIKMLKGKR